MTKKEHRVVVLSGYEDPKIYEKIYEDAVTKSLTYATLKEAVEEANSRCKECSINDEEYTVLTKYTYDGGGVHYRVSYMIHRGEPSLDYEEYEVYVGKVRVPAYFKKVDIYEIRAYFAFCIAIGQHHNCAWVYPNHIWKAREGKGTDYTLAERTYVMNSDQWGFDPDKSGRCIIGTDLAMTETCRIDGMSHSPEYGYLIPDDEASAFYKEAHKHDPWSRVPESEWSCREWKFSKEAEQ